MALKKYEHIAITRAIKYLEYRVKAEQKNKDYKKMQGEQNLIQFQDNIDNATYALNICKMMLRKKTTIQTELFNYSDV